MQGVKPLRFIRNRQAIGLWPREVWIVVGLGYRLPGNADQDILEGWLVGIQGDGTGYLRPPVPRRFTPIPRELTQRRSPQARQTPETCLISGVFAGCGGPQSPKSTRLTFEADIE